MPGPTAFLPAAFQNDAFQIADTPPPVDDAQFRLGGPTVMQAYPFYQLAEPYDLRRRTN